MEKPTKHCQWALGNKSNAGNMSPLIIAVMFSHELCHTLNVKQNKVLWASKPTGIVFHARKVVGTFIGGLLQRLPGCFFWWFEAIFPDIC